MPMSPSCPAASAVGWRCARSCYSAPTCLLLDEPTNHLDAESVAWLEHHLHEYPGTIVAVTHDRYFLDNVAGWILELDRGAGIPWEGNYSSWLDQKRKRLEGEEKTESARQRTLARELEWVRASPRARQAKSKARLAAYEQLLADEAQKREDSVEISVPPGPRLGDLVVKAEGLEKSFGDRLLIENLSFNLPRGGIVGVIGPNGAGKTTMFRMLVGQEKPDKGTLRIGDTVKFAYVDQSRDTLDGDKSVFDEIAQGAEFLEIGKRKVNARAYVSGFNFRGTDQQKRVKDLSGGERNRVHLAKVLEVRRQRAAAGRADQRSGRGHPARAGGRLAAVRRLRGGDQPRSLVPGSHRHPHPGLRRQQPGGLVRGELPGLRGGQEATPGRGRRPAPPHPLQEADPLTRGLIPGGGLGAAVGILYC